MFPLTLMQKIHLDLTVLSFEGNVSSLVAYELESVMISVIGHGRLVVWLLTSSVTCLSVCMCIFYFM